MLFSIVYWSCLNFPFLPDIVSNSSNSSIVYITTKKSTSSFKIRIDTGILKPFTIQYFGSCFSAHTSVTYYLIGDFWYSDN